LKTLLILASLALAAAIGTARADDAHKGHAHAARPVQTAYGIAGDPSKVARTITLDMTDNMRFTPSALDVKLGETVRFVLANKGVQMHEMVLGTRDELAQHAAMMRQRKPMDHHALPAMAHVMPGKKGEIVWRFNRAGTFDFACLMPGHFEAGMLGTVTVK
jgi:uncharacterized cupredoxin-like copper-binding protein